jgi:DNA-binding XRE family transcriptional regulator
MSLDSHWIVTDEPPESRRGERIYLREVCPCGYPAHYLDKALACGLLTDVRRSRRMAGEAVAHEIGVARNTIYRWARGEVVPQNVYARLLEDWLDKGAIPVSAQPATASEPGGQP